MPRTTRFAPVSAPTYVERTALPRIYLQGKGTLRYHAYVHSYVAGTPASIKGAQVTPLFSLSLVAMRGHASVLKGLWSALVARHLEEIFIDGLDRVALAHHVLPDLPYQLHWNYHQETLVSGELHAVIESRMLSIRDPLRAQAAAERSRRSGARKRGGRVEAATMSKKDETDEEEVVLRQLFPMFVLLAPGSLQPGRSLNETEEDYACRCENVLTSWREQQHFSFLDPRYPFPLAPEWSSYLWQRGRRHGEITRLKTWSPSVPQRSSLVEASGQPPLSVPFFLEAWLCRPNPLQMKLDLDAAHARSELALPAWLGSAQPVRERELVGSFS